MRQIRRFQDLTIGDNYMFGAVMMENDNCRQLLERVLEMPISRVEVIKEKSMIYHPECKGVRLDVYAKDEKNTHYDVEMQLLKRDALPKRSRYYHSQMDMELLASGERYDKLPNTYVIFICDFDLFSDGKYRYRFQNVCRETGRKLGDGAETTFLSTRGKNPDEVSEELVSFLEFVRMGQDGNLEEFGDMYVTRLQDSIRQIKENRGKERQYMMWQDIIDDAKEEGRQDMREPMVAMLKGMLSRFGTLPDEVVRRIDQETDMDKITVWAQLVVKAKSLEDFVDQM